MLLIGETITIRQNAGKAFLAAASVLWVVVIVLTLILPVPANSRIANMDSAAFTDSLRREHTRWDVLHRCRVVVSVSMICMLIGIRR